MKTKHTPEPWAAESATGIEHIFSKCHGGIATIPSIGSAREEHQANAARIVACVNACAGMEDPAYEIEFLREQLRECTDALRGMVEATTLECSAANGFYDQRNKAKKVIEDLTPRP